MGSINKNLVINKISCEPDKNDMEINSNSIKINSSTENENLTLVEAIEELGFIPSIDRDNDSKAW